MQFAQPLARTDKEVVLTAVKRDGPALKYVALELRADKEVVLAAVAADLGSLALRYAAPELQEDEEIQKNVFDGIRVRPRVEQPL